MRKLVLIAGVVGIIMYGAAVSQQGLPAVAAPHETAVQAPGQGLEALLTALEATGAGLEIVTLTGWGEVPAVAGRDRVLAALGTGPVGGESRTVTVHDRDGRHYVTVRWTLAGTAVARWPAAVTRLQQALNGTTKSSAVSIQLEGTTRDEKLMDVTDRAMNALGATDRQPWSDPRAASVAGRTTQFPPGPFGVNVQVAVRSDPAKGVARVWVAWPALMQEY